MNKSIMKLVGLVAGAAVIAASILITPPEGLTHEALVAIGWLLGAIVWMIFDTFEDYVAMLAMCSGWVVCGAAPTAVAFSTFSNNTWLLLVGALAIGAGASKSGLLRRITLLMLKTFPATHKGQYYGLIASGLVVGPLIPSTTAKGAILGQIAASISDTLGFERGTRASAGLFAAFFIG
ncbi:MAG: anion permease, partial [Lachnospiraceae bacterium]|nr:anion permease [Lachnospiraceae bacterium]